MSFFKQKLNDLKNIQSDPQASAPMSFFTNVVKKGAKIVEHARNEVIGELAYIVLLRYRV